MTDRLERVKRAAEGRWPELWASYGMAHEHFEKPNRPCPICGGRDRFTYFAKETGGRWYCRGCGCGDGIDLVRRVTGQSFPETLESLESRLGLVRPAPAPEKKSFTPEEKEAYAQKMRAERQREAAEKLWAEAEELGDLPDHPVQKYLHERGLYPALSGLRSVRVVEKLPYWEEGSVKGEYPAVLFALTDDAGRVVTLHRLWRSETGRKAPVSAPKKLLGSPEGGLVRLYEAGETLAFTEGVETAMAVRAMTGLSVWACVSAVGLLSLTLERIPASVKSVEIYGDNDESYVGQAAAYGLAAKLHRDARAAGRELSIRVRIPERTGYDWNDVLLKSLAKEKTGGRKRLRS